jgi:predicted regulator of Ras-like GTPase activity (Roadblock/LC7/MglB family)
MVGGLVLARAVDDPDLSDEILAAVSASVVGSSQDETQQ